MTVLEVIKRSADFLEKKGVESPRLQVELLLSHLLNLPRMKLYLGFDRVLTPKELEGLREMVKRRGQREPLQHIVGSTSFWGYEIAVNSSVLVPRPETEMLAELGWNFLSAECGVRRADLGSEQMSGVALNDAPVNAPGRTVRVLDFGTGSGCLAITVAIKCPSAQVVALDISPEALEMARKNAERNQAASRIEFVLGDGFGALPAKSTFDLIVGNPPYIPSAEIATLDAEVRDFDPRLALDGGQDGLDFYRRLAIEASIFLKPGGRIMLEFGDGQERDIQTIFEQQKWIVEAVKADYSGRPRILVAHRGNN